APLFTKPFSRSPRYCPLRHVLTDRTPHLGWELERFSTTLVLRNWTETSAFFFAIDNTDGPSMSKHPSIGLINQIPLPQHIQVGPARKVAFGDHLLTPRRTRSACFRCGISSILPSSPTVPAPDENAFTTRSAYSISSADGVKDWFMGSTWSGCIAILPVKPARRAA